MVSRRKGKKQVRVGRRTKRRTKQASESGFPTSPGVSQAPVDRTVNPGENYRSDAERTTTAPSPESEETKE